MNIEEKTHHVHYQRYQKRCTDRMYPEKMVQLQKTKKRV